MAGYNAQHQRNIDAMSPPEHDGPDSNDAMETIENRLKAADEVGEVLHDMVQEGDTWPALDRLVCGHPKQFGDARVLQVLLGRVKLLHDDFNREMQS